MSFAWMRVSAGNDNNTHVIIDLDEGGELAMVIPFGLKYKDTLEGQHVEKGQIISDGVINPHDVLRLKGEIAVQDYLIKEVQNVYRLQGVDINDKHIEVIVRQMIRKVRIEENGTEDMLVGTLADKYAVEEKNKEIREKNRRRRYYRSGNCQLARTARYHQGCTGNRFFLLCRVLPGNYKGSYRCRCQG